MPSTLKSIRLLSDPTRVRIALLLDAEELSVAELQAILSMGQSRISTHLAQLKQAGLVEDRRVGKNILYRMREQRGSELYEALMRVLRECAGEISETAEDREALELVLRRRQDKVRAYFDELAGRFGRQYVPGRSWKGLAECLILLMPRAVIADLGAGEGTFAQLVAQRAERVIAIDDSEKMVEYGAHLAREHGLANLEYRKGDLESLPIEDSSVDIAFLSQSLHHARHPDRAVAEAYRILRPGGRVAILDLVRHGFEEAREIYADLWLGFTEVELRRFLCTAGFGDVQTSVVHREAEAPHFETLLAVAAK
jgi:ubiquinone/menaquinone biosynthesis C-methylase UbiE/DNA-binding transcriptional ArsR family regulator